MHVKLKRNTSYCTVQIHTSPDILSSAKVYKIFLLYQLITFTNASAVLDTTEFIWEIRLYHNSFISVYKHDNNPFYINRLIDNNIVFFKNDCKSQILNVLKS